MSAANLYFLLSATANIFRQEAFLVCAQSQKKTTLRPKDKHEPFNLTPDRSHAHTHVISAERLGNGHTLLGGVGLTEANMIEFLELDSEDAPFRSTRFRGDYVRRSSAASANTILFTCDSLVIEGDWRGRTVRQFSIPGFRHAWKAIRATDNTTFISAGYGAFIVQCDENGQELRRWSCPSGHEEIHPFFFGDFALLPTGGLLVCNWLGHGTNLGASGYSLLEFDAGGLLIGAWRDTAHTSSLQSFALAPSC